MSLASLNEFTKTYGPFAFGIASLLILWYTILKPELDSKRIDFEQHRKIIEEQSQQVKLLQMSAATLHDTATLLDSTVKRLEVVRSAN